MIADFNLDPTRGSETGKIRPCIVVTNDVYNRRVPVVQVIPVTAWNEKKCRIAMNVELSPSTENGLTKLSIADCLQTRPVDFAARCVQMRGRVDAATLTEIDTALRIVFGLG
ncbi:MAG: type II toxin-antitoxin system PemK/MazF family toxin [Candidatus Kapaibacterium sp.]|nr:MAG: type II toxin-antitoxin system PemK/MazF family toxin [Candidatus Kapabacteria bacterium]